MRFYTKNFYDQSTFLYNNLHFNDRKKSNDAKFTDIITRAYISIDTLKVDDHSRITFTKKTKNIFPVQVGDSIALYQSTQNENNLIFNLQRRGTIIDTWICKRGYVAKKEIYTDNIISDNNNIENNRFYTTSVTPSKSNPTPGVIVKTTNFSVPNNLQTNSNSILEHDSNYYNDRSSKENAISNNIKTKSLSSALCYLA